MPFSRVTAGRRRFRIATACALWLIAACSGGDATAPSASVSIVGSWALQTVNGSALPYLMDQNGADKSEMTAEVLTFLATGQFTEIAQVRVTSGGQVSTLAVQQAGTFTANKGNVTLTFAGDGSTAQGSQSGSTLTLGLNGLNLSYKKQ